MGISASLAQIRLHGTRVWYDWFYSGWVQSDGLFSPLWKDLRIPFLELAFNIGLSQNRGLIWWSERLEIKSGSFASQLPNSPQSVWTFAGMMEVSQKHNDRDNAFGFQKLKTVLPSLPRSAVKVPPNGRLRKSDSEFGKTMHHHRSIHPCRKERYGFSNEIPNLWSTRDRPKTVTDKRSQSDLFEPFESFWDLNGVYVASKALFKTGGWKQRAVFCGTNILERHRSEGSVYGISVEIHQIS
jgi:hypothetical protein